MTNITAKLILNVAHHGWAMRKIFHSRLSKTALNSSLLPYDLTKKHQICILYQDCTKDLIKDCIKNCVRHWKIFFRHDSGSKRNWWKNERSEPKRSQGCLGGGALSHPPAGVLGSVAPYGTFYGLQRPLDLLKTNSNFINCGYEARQKS